MPKAGKSSVIETIRHFFSHGPKIKVETTPDEHSELQNGYKVHSPAEGVSLRTPGYLKRNLLDYNAWAGSYAIQQLIEGRHDSYHDIVILDRGPWDAGCWLEYVRHHPPEDVEAEQVKTIADFFQHPLWITQTDLHVILVVSPEEAAERAGRNRLIRHLGPAAMPEMMSEIFEIYKKRYRFLVKVKASQCIHVGDRSAMLIDTSQKKPMAVAVDVIETVFDVLQRKIQARRSRGKLTVDMVLRHFESYRKGMRHQEFNKLRTYISREFVPQVNDLPIPRRVEVAARLSSRTLYLTQGTSLFNRFEAEPVISELKRILED
ncbi:MAG: hypothetical protein ISS70_23120 [Phycisphaerae bacterium]|nr:hypothetical protein [Phycisphaerae bacterium]